MNDPLRQLGNVYRPVQWDRQFQRDRRRDRWRGLLGLVPKRKIIIGAAVLALLIAVGMIVGGEELPPTEPAPAPADETEALVAVRAAEARAGFGIIVRVADGTVTLIGTVATPTERAAAESVARSVVGADFRINNRLLIDEGDVEPAEEEPANQLAAVTDEDLVLQNAISSVLARNPITFASASADIDPESLATLDALADILRDSAAQVLIAGHTDTDGDPDDNLLLSQQRAEAVVTYLTEAGIDPARLTAQGFGGSFPVADNITKEGKAANRRIEALIQPSESG